MYMGLTQNKPNVLIIMKEHVTHLNGVTHVFLDKTDLYDNKNNTGYHHKCSLNSHIVKHLNNDLTSWKSSKGYGKRR